MFPAVASNRRHDATIRGVERAKKDLAGHSGTASMRVLAREDFCGSMSSMSSDLVDATVSSRIAALGQRVLDGGAVSREEALGLFSLTQPGEIHDLMGWANRIRERFQGNQVHLCSIVNVKAGGCAEDCRFCAQSSFYETASPRHGLLDREPVMQAAEEARRNGVTGLGIVAAWRGLKEGPVLDEICERLQDITKSGGVRADASLGLIQSQPVADRLKAAGCEVYNHNLETSRRFFPQQCTTHTFEDRLATLRHLKQAGIRLCCGGIIGMGETVEDRCDLALELRQVNPEFVPINILNPIPGTPFEKVPPLTPLEILKNIACFRFILPRQHIMIAGGRVVNLRDVQSMIFLAGASALMVGNYLTTMNQPVEQDLRMIRDLGLSPLGMVTPQSSATPPQ
jgi:biotin synthase